MAEKITREELSEAHAAAKLAVKCYRAGVDPDTMEVFEIVERKPKTSKE